MAAYKEIDIGQDSYLNTINISENKGDLYLNEVLYSFTRQFRNNKKILAVTAAPTLYDTARKLLRGDKDIEIISPIHIKSKT